MYRAIVVFTLAFGCSGSPEPSPPASQPISQAPAATSPHGTTGDAGPAGDANPTGAPDACRHVRCPAGAECVGGDCRPIEGECTTDVECPGNQRCVDGACACTCFGDGSCPAGQICDCHCRAP